MNVRGEVSPTCEIQGCRSKGIAKLGVGLMQVYDGKTPTMNRPGWMCSACIAFARKCGMRPQVIPEGAA